MRLGVVFAAASVIAGTPVLVLVVFSAAGLLSFQAALGGIFAISMAAFALALIWARDVEAIFDALSREIAEMPGERRSGQSDPAFHEAVEIRD